jgi:hypothetical protein
MGRHRARVTGIEGEIYFLKIVRCMIPVIVKIVIVSCEYKIEGLRCIFVIFL